MRQKLLAKGFPASLVDAVLSDLAEEGYLSDDRFRDSYVRARSAKGYGALRIRQELRLRGIDCDHEKEFETMDWDALIQRVYAKKYGNTAPESLLERAARQRFLAQRGFGHDQIAALFRRLKDGEA